MKKLLTACFLCLVCCEAMADNWQWTRIYSGISADFSKLDTKRHRGWVRYDGQNGKTIISLRTANCSARKLNTPIDIHYKSNGDFETVLLLGDLSITPISDTGGEAIFNYLCGQ